MTNVTFSLILPNIQQRWIKKPRIVFDQEGSPYVWGKEGVFLGDFDGDQLTDSLNFLTPDLALHDWGLLNEDTWNPLCLSSLLSSSAVVTPGSSQDFSFSMTRFPDRARKASISDIIDVLNIKDDRISSWDTKESPRCNAPPAPEGNFNSSESSSKQNNVSQPHGEESTSELSGSYNLEGLSKGTKTTPPDTAHFSSELVDSQFDDLDSGYSASPRESPNEVVSNANNFSGCEALLQPSLVETLPSIINHIDVERKLNEAMRCWSHIKGTVTESSNVEKQDKVVPRSKDFQLNFDEGKPKEFNDIQNKLVEPIVDLNGKKKGFEEASSLLNSKEDAVIMVLGEDKTIKYVSTSRRKVEDFLVCAPSENKIEVVPNAVEHVTIHTTLDLNGISENDAMAEQKMVDNSTSRRGRKRVHEPDRPHGEREVKKRERNNEACRKFRQTQKMSVKGLFEQESKLLQTNLNLKEHLSMLSRQVAYIKGKLGLH